MNALDKIKEFVAATPGSTWWVEELLFRGEAIDGEHGGKLKGAHVMLGVKFVGPDGRENLTISDPIPVGDLPNGIPVADVLNELQLAQQKTIDDQQTKIASHTIAVTELNQQLALHRAEIQRLKGARQPSRR